MLPVSLCCLQLMMIYFLLTMVIRWSVNTCKPCFAFNYIQSSFTRTQLNAALGATVTKLVLFCLEMRKSKDRHKHWNPRSHYKDCKESSNVVLFLACVPLDSELTNGIVLRNDTENGIDYKFTCNRGFVMNGSNHLTCKDGVYNGTTPNCLPKGKKYFHFYRLDEFNNPTARRNCVQFMAFR